MLVSQKCEGSRGSLWVVTFEYHLPFFLCLFLEMCCPWTERGMLPRTADIRNQSSWPFIPADALVFMVDFFFFTLFSAKLCLDLALHPLSSVPACRAHAVGALLHCM